METQFIKLNMIPSGINPCFHVSQYDIGRSLGFIVYNGSEVVDLDSYTCTIEATRSDGVAITANVSTNDNVGTFETTATMTNKADKYKAQFVIVDGNSNRIASLPFDMDVVKAAMDENSESIEEDASLYQQYTEAVQDAIAEANADIQAEKNARIAAVSAEASARASADSNLQSQINQIIAPSGEAPSAAEVQNARIGADGVTYDTLGSAIRGQVTDLKSATKQDTRSILSMADAPIAYLGDFKIGQYVSGVYDSTSKNRICTNEILTANKSIYVYALTGWRFQVSFYSGGVFTNRTAWIDAYNIDKDEEFAITIARTTEVGSEIANIEEFARGLVYNAAITDFEKQTINILDAFGSGEKTYNSELEQGTYSLQSGEYDDNTRVRSGFIKFHPLINSVKVECESGYSLYFGELYNNEFTWLTNNWSQSCTTVTDYNKLYRYVVRKNDNARITPLPVNSKATITVYCEKYSTQSDLDNILESLSYEVPKDFIKTLAASKIDEVFTDAITENGTFVCMPWISDNHVNPADNDSLQVTEDTLACLNLVSKSLPVDFICHTGDLIDRPYVDGGGDGKGVCKSVCNYLDAISNMKTLLVTNGNHDGVDANTYYAWKFYHYLNGKICVPYTERPDRSCGYFCKDIPLKKLRLIFLSCPDDPNYYGWNTNQLHWLVESALNTPDNYSVMFFCHIPTVWTASVGGTALNNKTALETIITAYSTGSSGTVTLLDESTLSYSFATAKTVVAWFAGHTHRDYVVDVNETVAGGQTNGLPCKQIVIGASKFVNSSSASTVGGTAPTREMNTASEILFDVIMYYPDKHKVNLIRCGAGESRTVTVN